MVRLYKPLSDEVKKKISESLKARHLPGTMLGRTGNNHPKFGKRCSDSTKEKMRRAIHERYMSGWMPASAGGRSTKRFLVLSPLQQKLVVLKSSYEKRLVDFLSKANIDWYYEPIRFDLGDCTYLPDFYLPSLNMWIDVKGWISPTSELKMHRFTHLYPDQKLFIIDKEVLDKLCLV